jgi:hypothetical protein
MSREYIVSIALLVAALLKVFGIQMESGVLEGLIAGVAALYLAIRRYKRGDITIVGSKK